MTTDWFAQGLAFVMLPENDGQPYHNSPNDPGGATCYGVTYSTWSSWERLHKSVPTSSLFKTLGPDNFSTLYRCSFWNAAQCGQMGALGIQVFDAAVNCGPGNAARFLQSVLGVTVDGEVGPETLAVMATTDSKALCRLLCTAREAFYATRPTAKYFQRGWNARAERCRDTVLSLLNA